MQGLGSRPSSSMTLGVQTLGQGGCFSSAGPFQIELRYKGYFVCDKFVPTSKDYLWLIFRPTLVFVERDGS